MPRMQAIATALATFLTIIITATAAHAETERYASLVVDLESDTIIHARNADELRYPASLTKMMTLYMAFDALEAGELGLTDKVVMSKHSAGQPPSKLYIKPGDSLTVEEAIYALVTKSANDVAAALGERIGGSEWRFARMMTAKAKELGMTRTRFRNASGLPDEEQVTTATDMYLLSRALMENHPGYFGYFNTERFEFKGRGYGNHNNLLGRVTGVNGIKTGYTRASGYNLAASVERDGHRLIAVVLGGSTSRIRDAHMEDLIERSYEAIDEGVVNPTFVALNDSGTAPSSGFVTAAPRGPQVAAAPAVEKDEQELALASLELSKPAAQGSSERRGVKIVFADDAGEPTEEEAAPAPVEEKPEPAPARPEPVVVAMPEQTDGPVQLAAETPVETQTDEAAEDEKPAAVQMAKLVFDKQPQGVTAAPAPVEASPVADAEPKEVADIAVAARKASPVFQGEWEIQVGAFGSETKAAERLKEIEGLSFAALTAASTRVETTPGDKPMYRARFTGLSQIAAASLCADLTKRGDGCFPISPKS
ncbi:MAG: serine hydrolase [Euryhalocaulis sp.]|uniref:serine hydrolase n=1 Tax=Euryhalocaulis sp. TaxID=2744307 RepID=UPI0017C05734|nr:serine hydrolase [Euryhalocaulis sp.]MBA4800767.1 serine hydrolase [Euryhalocaulis sp.]